MDNRYAEMSEEKVVGLRAHFRYRETLAIPNGQGNACRDTEDNTWSFYAHVAHLLSGASPSHLVAQGSVEKNEGKRTTKNQ